MNLNLLQKAANAVRGLSMDGVQAANSGHPGLPMGAADFASLLWCHHLVHSPKNPKWKNRDRFVLSAGHGSMLLYSLLYLSGYDITLDDLKKFRQMNSRTPGHPEYGLTPGVETTTGPLGQGLANAVGMAIAESSLAGRYNTTERIIDHYTYALVSDGDLQEGISHEACALAAHLELGKLIVLYDDNEITIDGNTQLATSEDVCKRFEAYGWHTQNCDGHDFISINESLHLAKKETKRPSIIAFKTIIGKGSPNKSGTSAAHGAPLGVEELQQAKQILNLSAKDFFVEEEVLNFFRQTALSGLEAEQKWNQRYQAYSDSHPKLFKELDSLSHVIKPTLQTFKQEKMATRAASGMILDQITHQIPALVGGSADLTPSNNTLPNHWTSFSPQNRKGKYIHFGIREHGMAAILNGMALHGDITPYAGTFFVFTDYMRPAMRLSALMKQPIIYVLTHDSIGLGEDGPTHQPISHLTALRAIPNMTVFRPADANETNIAWTQAISNTQGPTALILTRQSLPVFPHEYVADAKRGGYILFDDPNPQVILMASGSEVHIAVKAKQKLNQQKIQVRLVSMPSMDIFDKQAASYKKAILPDSLPKRVAIEAGATLSWHKYIGLDGAIIGLDEFGASAPYQQLYEHFGLTPDKIVESVLDML